jgi:hypothetical protein
MGSEAEMVVAGLALLVVVLTLGLARAALRAQQRKLDGLPRDVWALVKKERGSAEDQSIAKLREAEKLADGIRSYHQQLEAVLTAERHDADMRARLVERRARDAGIALDVATKLVTEARGLVERLTPREPLALPPEPAQIAAGPQRPQSARPHASPRRATLLGIHGPAPARPSPPPAPPAAAAVEEERPSEEEVTRIGPRPAPEQIGTAKTLMSMPAVGTPGKRAVAPRPQRSCSAATSATGAPPRPNDWAPRCRGRGAGPRRSSPLGPQPD